MIDDTVSNGTMPNGSPNPYSGGKRSRTGFLNPSFLKSYKDDQASAKKEKGQKDLNKSIQGLHKSMEENRRAQMRSGSRNSVPGSLSSPTINKSKLARSEADSRKLASGMTSSVNTLQVSTKELSRSAELMARAASTQEKTTQKLMSRLEKTISSFEDAAKKTAMVIAKPPMWAAKSAGRAVSESRQAQQFKSGWDETKSAGKHQAINALFGMNPVLAMLGAGAAGKGIDLGQKGWQKLMDHRSNKRAMQYQMKHNGGVIIAHSGAMIQPKSGAKRSLKKDEAVTILKEGETVLPTHQKDFLARFSASIANAVAGADQNTIKTATAGNSTSSARKKKPVLYTAQQDYFKDMEEALRNVQVESEKGLYGKRGDPNAVKSVFSNVVPIFGSQYKSDLPRVNRIGIMAALYRLSALQYVHSRFASDESNKLLMQQAEMMKVGFGLKGNIRGPKARTLATKFASGIRKVAGAGGRSGGYSSSKAGGSGVGGPASVELGNQGMIARSIPKGFWGGGLLRMRKKQQELDYDPKMYKSVKKALDESDIGGGGGGGGGKKKSKPRMGGLIGSGIKYWGKLKEEKQHRKLTGDVPKNRYAQLAWLSTQDDVPFSQKLATLLYGIKKGAKVSSVYEQGKTSLFNSMAASLERHRTKKEEMRKMKARRKQAAEANKEPWRPWGSPGSEEDEEGLHARTSHGVPGLIFDEKSMRYKYRGKYISNAKAEELQGGSVSDVNGATPTVAQAASGSTRQPRQPRQARKSKTATDKRTPGEKVIVGALEKLIGLQQQSTAGISGLRSDSSYMRKSKKKEEKEGFWTKLFGKKEKKTGGGKDMGELLGKFSLAGAAGWIIPMLTTSLFGGEGADVLKSGKGTIIGGIAGALLGLPGGIPGMMLGTAAGSMIGGMLGGFAPQKLESVIDVYKTNGKGAMYGAIIGGTLGLMFGPLGFAGGVTIGSFLGAKASEFLAQGKLGDKAKIQPYLDEMSLGGMMAHGKETAMGAGIGSILGLMLMGPTGALFGATAGAFLSGTVRKLATGDDDFSKKIQGIYGKYVAGKSKEWLVGAGMGALLGAVLTGGNLPVAALIGGAGGMIGGWFAEKGAIDENGAKKTFVDLFAEYTGDALIGAGVAGAAGILLTGFNIPIAMGMATIGSIVFPRLRAKTGFSIQKSITSLMSKPIFPEKIAFGAIAGAALGAIIGMGNPLMIAGGAGLGATISHAFDLPGSGTLGEAAFAVAKGAAEHPVFTSVAAGLGGIVGSIMGWRYMPAGFKLTGVKYGGAIGGTLGGISGAALSDIGVVDQVEKHPYITGLATLAGGVLASVLAYKYTPFLSGMKKIMFVAKAGSFGAALAGTVAPTAEAFMEMAPGGEFLKDNQTGASIGSAAGALVGGVLGWRMAKYLKVIPGIPGGGSMAAIGMGASVGAAIGSYTGAGVEWSMDKILNFMSGGDGSMRSDLGRGLGGGIGAAAVGGLVGAVMGLMLGGPPGVAIGMAAGAAAGPLILIAMQAYKTSQAAKEAAEKDAETRKKIDAYNAKGSILGEGNADKLSRVDAKEAARLTQDPAVIAARKKAAAEKFEDELKGKQREKDSMNSSWFSGWRADSAYQRSKAELAKLQTEEGKSARLAQIERDMLNNDTRESLGTRGGEAKFSGNITKEIERVKGLIEQDKAANAPASQQRHEAKLAELQRMVAEGGVEAKAKGGITKAPITLVGEEGPELVALPKGSRVMSNSDMKKSVGGSVGSEIKGIDFGALGQSMKGAFAKAKDTVKTAASQVYETTREPLNQATMAGESATNALATGSPPPGAPKHGLLWNTAKSALQGVWRAISSIMGINDPTVDAMFEDENASLTDTLGMVGNGALSKASEMVNQISSKVAGKSILPSYDLLFKKNPAEALENFIKTNQYNQFGASNYNEQAISSQLSTTTTQMWNSFGFDGLKKLGEYRKAALMDWAFNYYGNHPGEVAALTNPSNKKGVFDKLPPEVLSGLTSGEFKSAALGMINSDDFEKSGNRLLTDAQLLLSGEKKPTDPGSSDITALTPSSLSDMYQGAKGTVGKYAGIAVDKVKQIYGGLSQSFLDKSVKVANALNMDPAKLLAIMHFESGFQPNVPNKAGSGAMGLIQFMPKTAAGLGTSTQALAGMSAEGQLDYVYKYLLPYKGKFNDAADAYMAVLSPNNIGRPLDSPMINGEGKPWVAGTTEYAQNAGLDIDKDGVITKRDAASKVIDLYEKYKGVLSSGVDTAKGYISDSGVIQAAKATFSGATWPPVAGSITSPFGTRTLNGKEENHPGLDFGAPVGSPVRAVLGGKAVQKQDPTGYGNYMVVEHPGGINSIYAHLSGNSVNTGDTVKAGQVIGQSGGEPGAPGSGRSFGPHLHFGVEKGDDMSQWFNPSSIFGGGSANDVTSKPLIGGPKFIGGSSKKSSPFSLGLASSMGHSTSGGSSPSWLSGVKGLPIKSRMIEEYNRPISTEGVAAARASQELLRGKTFAASSAGHFQELGDRVGSSGREVGNAVNHGNAIIVATMNSNAQSSSSGGQTQEEPPMGVNLENLTQLLLTGCAGGYA